MWHLNGKLWSLQVRNDPEGNGYLAVSCVSAMWCAVLNGSYGSYRLPLWNGRRWTTEPGPHNPNADVSSLACTSATACLAVGTTFSYAKTPLNGTYTAALTPLAWQWNGRALTDVSPG